MKQVDPKEVLRAILVGTFSVDDAEKIVEAISAVARSDGRSVVPIALTPDQKIAELLNIHPKTLDRWSDDPELGFPPPIEIKGRYYPKHRAVERLHPAPPEGVDSEAEGEEPARWRGGMKR